MGWGGEMGSVPERWRVHSVLECKISVLMSPSLLDAREVLMEWSES